MVVTTISDAASSAIITLLMTSGLLTGIAYFFLRSRLKKIQEKTEESLESKLHAAMQAELDKNLNAPPEVQSDGVLPDSSAVLGVIKLEAYAQKIQPKFIVGINRGGWLLSTYLAHRLEIKRTRILRYDSEKDSLLETNAQSKISASDRILLVDDISRSGNSIRKGLAYVQSAFPSSLITTSVLVVCKGSQNRGVDFAAYYTKDPDIQLPWSSEARKREARERLATVGKKALLVGHSKQSLEEDADILRLAHDDDDELAQTGIDIAINDLEPLRLYEIMGKSWKAEDVNKSVA